MKYFFILGSNPTLSIAELSAVFELDNNSQFEFLNENTFILDLKEEVDAEKLIRRLGGTIKIGIIKSQIKSDNKKIISEALNLIKMQSDGKTKFGISYYGKKKLNEKIIGMELKKTLKEKGASARWVVSRDKTLSSVVVEQNKLIAQGAEIVLIQKDNELLIGKTLAVQAFKELSFRDYGRPSRDDFSGMLPPKLAQIMINLAGIKSNEKIILDPSCGSGTILSEALLMGYKNLIGTDVSQKAVDDSKKNLEWIIKNWKLKIENLEIYKHDATKISQELKSTIDNIITEPYLGPQRGKLDIKAIKKELENLYSASISEFRKILKPAGKIVMIWPEFHITYNAARLFPNINGFKIINPIPEKLRQNKIIHLTERNTIIYGRPGQKVWREIVILK